MVVCEDERAVVDSRTGTLLVSSVAHGRGAGGADRHGDVEVVQLVLASGAIRRTTLADAFEANDHNSAALYVRPDDARWRPLELDTAHAQLTVRQHPPDRAALGLAFHDRAVAARDVHDLPGRCLEVVAMMRSAPCASQV